MIFVLETEQYEIFIRPITTFYSLSIVESFGDRFGSFHLIIRT